ncbi:MAG: glycosyltransferase family 2 protein, partial [Planctomycetota bacterium]
MSVAAVVVTHNRLALLRQCLAALDTQTRRPDAIYIVDNASTDGTTDAVAERCAGRDDLHHLRLRENRGGAGGFHAGMARAYSDGHEWIWVMDDDSLPRPDCAQQLIDAQTCYPARWKAKVLASRVEWTDGREHPLNRVAPKRRFHRGFARLARRRGHLSIRCASFVSIAFHRDCIARFGLPIAAYFIWSDDIEYTARVLRRLPGIQVPASVAVHATGEPTGTLDAPPERFRYYVRNHRAMLLHSDAFR